MAEQDILRELAQLKEELQHLREATRYTWVQALIGVMVGAIVTFFANYLIFRWTRKKEDRRLLVQIVARMTGICRKYGDIVLRVELARIWQGYIINSLDLGIQSVLTLDMWLEREKEALYEYDNIRREFEMAFTEYLGMTGTKDQEFINLIVELRGSGIGDTDYKPAKTIKEFNEINIQALVNERIKHHMDEDKSLNKILMRISFHLRNVIAPITLPKKIRNKKLFSAQ